MTKPLTRADLQKRVEYWQEKYCELEESKKREIADLQQKCRINDERLSADNWQLCSAKELWNKWIEADKGLTTKEAYAVWDPETFQQLLYLLRP